MGGKGGSFWTSQGYAWGGVVLALVLLAGCGSRARESRSREESTLKPLAILYGQYIGQHRGQPPTNEAEFRQFVQTQGPSLLQSFGLSNIEELFVSPRDGKPYKILYGPTALKGPPGPAGSPVVAYEQEGRGGKRWVASAMGAVEEVDETRFKELVPTGP